MRPSRGFTLVEVLVALSIMSIMALMAWQGVDGITRSREVTRDRAERTLRLQTAIAQWEQDLGALQDERIVPALTFDGATFRLTRRTPDGMQMVAWAIRGGSWWRWSGPVTTRAADLQQSWFASQQLLGNEPQQLKVLPGVDRWQVYCFRGAGWSNCQSSSDVVQVEVPAAGASAPKAAQRIQLPTGVRLELSVASTGGAATLVRDVALAPQVP